MEITTIKINCDKCVVPATPCENYDTNKILFILACGHKFNLEYDELPGYKILPSSYYLFDVAIPDAYILPNATNKILEYEEIDDGSIYYTELRMIIYDHIETYDGYEIGCAYYPFEEQMAIGDIIICDLNNLKIMADATYFDEKVYPCLLTRIPEDCTLIDIKTTSNTPEFSGHLRVLTVTLK